MDISLLYNQLLAKVTALGASVDVTHYTLSLGAQDAVTGIPAKSYSVGTTIEMLLFGKAAQQILTGTGLYVRTDAVGLTKTLVSQGDKIKNAANHYYTVESAVPNPIGDIVIFFTVNLTYLGDFTA
jgi:UDP-N-acetylglucosamine enolpyruvyl transferase